MKTIYIGCTILLLLTSCYSTLSKPDREKIKNSVANREVNVGRGAEVFYVSFSYENAVITYSFKGTKFLDTTVAGDLNSRLTNKIHDSLLQEARSTMELLSKYRVYSSTEKFKKVGIPLKLYMEESSVYLYCPDTMLLTRDYKSYIRTSKFLGSGWYYKDNDN